MNTTSAAEQHALPQPVADKRQSLLAAARRLIGEEGLEGLKVRPLAEAAGVSVGLVVYHFPDRQQMRLEVHESLVQEYLRARVIAVEAESDPRRRLLASVASGLPPLADVTVIRPLFELHGLARRSGSHSTLLSRLWESEVGLYMRVIDEGVAARWFGPVVSVEDAARALLALEDGLALHQVSNNVLLPAEAAVATFVDVAASLLRCPSLAEL